ncbi:hypothetical protein HNQ59_002763 [Chitinivorax tropicus]|uniref:Uncharacterized protein n=1 Tax=Chitinivorax tropicus TaxID=714531 RepID=A0A840MWB9_9PROT|nr:hypothetical protein [Chitinivorax tropicus]MBB5019461.1 hypothetical protein [Chitinivorax tropicus]
MAALAVSVFSPMGLQLVKRAHGALFLHAFQMDIVLGHAVEKTIWQQGIFHILFNNGNCGQTGLQ